MYIKKEYNFNDLKNTVWSGAIDTINTIEEHNKEDALMDLLEEMFFWFYSRWDTNKRFSMVWNWVYIRNSRHWRRRLKRRD